MSPTATDKFAGFGGSSQGLREAGFEVVMAANHAELAIAVHEENFPGTRHHRGDITEADYRKWPRTDFSWSSPACPPWANARGKRRDFDKSTQNLLFNYLTPKELAEAEELSQRRALMEEVPRYLRAMASKGEPVLGGVVENVVECRRWAEFDRWRREIELAAPAGYKTKLIALNSMHAQSRRTRRAPQSRDRFYLAFWLRSLGRDPDWDKWLRPRANCPCCEAWVDAIQVFKRRGADMGKYRSQYLYRCPKLSCRGQVVEPEFAPALIALDLSDPGIRIGDRAAAGKKPLAVKTRGRIGAAISRYARPVTVEVFGHQYDSLDPKHRRYGDPDGYIRAWPADAPLTTQSTTATKGVALPPMLVPAGGTWNDTAQPASLPMRARTATESEGVLVAPAMVMRNNGSKGDPGYLSTLIDREIGTLATAGHQSLVVPPWSALYAYDTGDLRSLGLPMPTQTAIDGDGVLTGEGLPDVDDCYFRMLKTAEIQAGMAFSADYDLTAAKTKEAKTRGLGNAVTPPVGEVLGLAFMEAFTGEAIAQ